MPFSPAIAAAMLIFRCFRRFRQMPPTLTMPPLHDAADAAIFHADLIRFFAACLYFSSFSRRHFFDLRLFSP